MHSVNGCILVIYLPQVNSRRSKTYFLMYMVMTSYVPHYDKHDDNWASIEPLIVDSLDGIPNECRRECELAICRCGP